MTYKEARATLARRLNWLKEKIHEPEREDTKGWHRIRGEIGALSFYLEEYDRVVRELEEYKTTAAVQTQEAYKARKKLREAGIEP